MHVVNGWRPVLPAGKRPSKRTGHVVTFDKSSSRMLVSHGLNWRKTLLSDTWILDIDKGTWSCIAGDSDDCSAGPGNGGVRPPAMAFAAYASIDQRLFTFGGTTQASSSGVSGTPVYV